MIILISSGPAFRSGVGTPGRSRVGSQVDILIEFEPHFEKDFGFEDSLGDFLRSPGIDAHCAKEDGVVRRQFLQRRIREGLAGFEIMFAAERIVGGGIGEPEFASRFLENFETGGDDFVTDAIAGHDRDFHRCRFISSESVSQHAGEVRERLRMSRQDGETRWFSDAANGLPGPVSARMTNKRRIFSLFLESARNCAVGLKVPNRRSIRNKTAAPRQTWVIGVGDASRAIDSGEEKMQ